MRTGLYTSPHLARFTERIRIAGAEADGDRLAALDRLVAATGGAADVLRGRDRAGLPVDGGGGGRDRRAGNRARRPAGCGDHLRAVRDGDHVNRLRSHWATSATRCRRSRARRPASSSRASRVSSAGCRPKRTASWRARQGRWAHRCSGWAATSTCRRSRSALPGAHQQDNAALAVELARAASRRLGRPIDDGALARGLAGVRWPGRCERVGDDLLFDCAHNPDGARALAAAVKALAPGRRVVVLVSIVDDKDPEAILAALAPGGVGDRRDPFGQSARAAGGGARGDRGAPGQRRRRLRRSRRRAGRGTPARRSGRPGRGVRLDVPGRNAARARAGRAGRSGDDVGPRLGQNPQRVPNLPR